MDEIKLNRVYRFNGDGINGERTGGDINILKP
jgi:hypothetical protein